MCSASPTLEPSAALRQMTPVGEQLVSRSREARPRLERTGFLLLGEPLSRSGVVGKSPESYNSGDDCHKTLEDEDPPGKEKSERESAPNLCRA